MGDRTGPRTLTLSLAFGARSGTVGARSGTVGAGDGLTIWDSTQSVFEVRKQVAGYLGLPLEVLDVRMGALEDRLATLVEA